jgi:hypothetical protein
MALWRDPLDELIADLERTLPIQSTPNNPRLPWKDLVEMQLMVQEIMKRSPRVPFAPDPSDDPEATEHHKGSEPSQ